MGIAFILYSLFTVSRTFNRPTFRYYPTFGWFACGGSLESRVEQRERPIVLFHQSQGCPDVHDPELCAVDLELFCERPVHPVG